MNDNRSFHENEMEDAAKYGYEPQAEPTFSPNYHQNEPVMYDDTNSEGGDGDAAEDVSEDGTDSTQLAEAETRAVSWVRATVLAVLGLATVTSCTVVYRRTAATEQATFQAAYADAAEQLKDAFRVQWEPWQALAVDMQSYVRYSSADEWPMVALPDFGSRAASALSLGQAASIAVAPLVTDETLSDWETFSVAHQSDWLPSSSTKDHYLLEIPEKHEKVAETERRLLHHYIASSSSSSATGGIHDLVFTMDGQPVTPGEGPFLPLWQFAPLQDADNNITQWVNLDLTSVSSRGVGAALRHALQGEATLGSVVNVKSDAAAGPPEPIALDLWLQTLLGPRTDSFTAPASLMLYPLVDEQADKKVVGLLMAVYYWHNTFTHVLPPSVKGMVTVLHSTCGPDHETQQSFTYRLDGPNVTYMGQGDLHKKEFDSRMQTDVMLQGAAGEDYCQYTLSIYPSHRMKHLYVTHAALMHSFVVFVIFLVAGLVFVVYDLLVEYRQQVVMDHALQSTAIVSSLFPQAVRERLFEDEGGEAARQQRRRSSGGAGSYLFETPKSSIKTFLGGEESPASSEGQNKPIADLFPHCTVLFADIAGFTAWSSLRDPAQVFTLLESIYHAFDQIARKRGVFKVETIGDSYVAVTGLPEPQADHAIIMSRFARDCLSKMTEVTKSLELTLGPDTGDLAMRFGLHSGPVTAGVLRGERSRFQLFGDTVNTAARMESTGKRDKIQCSQATADVLTEAGKGHWVKPREEKVHAKGKGELQTYWIEIPSSLQRHASDELSGGGSSIDGSCHGQSKIWGQQEEIPEVVTQRARHQRLIDYNVDLLAQHLKRVEARRRVLAMNGAPQGKPAEIHRPSTEAVDDDSPTVLDEVKEVIRLPSFDPKSYKGHVDPASIELDAKVMSQLKRYVTIVGAMYRQNPFHNFEHASHVTMSVNKLMQRVVAPEESAFKKKDKKDKVKLNAEEVAANMHDYTFGITSDPLTQFGILFSALIHDCDHQGISNNQLIKEDSPMAEKYKGKSIAEQNSVDLAWDLLMDPDEYPDLQNVIFQNDDEYRRFRQVVVNVVMATDIFDAELSDLRKKRWDKAFDPAQSDDDDENRKATIVIEHIMQASDVAHTMQHWHVYQKWNRRLFDELYTAYTNGRMGVDPSTFWYNGEIKFFDTYVIPLAKKLKDCGVFGVSSDECLNYAINNRREWESKGQMITSELVSNWKQREAEEEERRQKEREEAAAAGGRASRGKRGGRFARRRSLFTAGG